VWNAGHYEFLTLPAPGFATIAISVSGVPLAG
jgi:hypothetical protein